MPFFSRNPITSDGCPGPNIGPDGEPSPSDRGRGHQRPPSAPGWVPVLGHALKYKKDPVAFLVAQHRGASKGAFRLNLAGLHTTVVSDEQAVRQVTNAPEAVLSERQGVADFGFLEALGDINVFVAVSAHKRILRECLSASGPGHAALRPVLVRCAEEAIDAYFVHPCPQGDGNAPSSGTGGTLDMMPTMRRVMLHMTMAFAVGEASLALIEDYVAFQDKLEDAIAAAAVLPRWLSGPLKLKPVEAMRIKLVGTLSDIIRRRWELITAADNAFSSSSLPGVWISELKRMQLTDLPGWDELRIHRGSTSGGRGGRGTPLPQDGITTPEVAAEIVISLLFAAHKNPSIGASQALLMAMEAPEHMARLEQELKDARREAAAQFSNLPMTPRSASSASESGANKDVGSPKDVGAPAASSQGGWSSRHVQGIAKLFTRRTSLQSKRSQSKASPSPWNSPVKATAAARSATLSPASTGRGDEAGSTPRGSSDNTRLLEASVAPGILEAAAPQLGKRLSDACSRLTSQTMATIRKKSSWTSPGKLGGPDQEESRDDEKDKLLEALGTPGILVAAAPHLGRCLSEACRLTAHTIGTIRKVAAPGGFSFTCKDGSEYHTACGSYVAVSHIAPSLDESIFEEAGKFNPDRFAKAPGGLISHAAFNEYQYTVFSQGLHRCPGQQLAMLMMKLVNLLLLHRFTLKPEKLPFPPVDFERATLGQRAGPCLVQFTPNVMSTGGSTAL